MEAGRFSAVIRMMHRLARVPDEVRHRLRWQLIDLADQSLIRRSRLFDSEWYLAQNPDVVAARINPLRHYLRHAREGRDPNPLFDSNWYLARNPDVAAAGVNPLVHYLRNGAAEGRDPNPWFDSDWYLAQNPDVAAAGINPLVHYLHNGVAEGRNPSPSFDARCYLAQNPDVAAAGINALVHFRLRGIHEGRVAPVATEFPQGLSFFRFTRQHRLGYVVRTAELSDDAASRPGGPHHAHSDQLPASCPRQAEPLNDAADIIAPPAGIGRSEVSHFRTMVVLTHRCMRLLRRAISVLVRQGPQTFVVKVLEVSHFRTMVVLIHRFMYLLRRAIGVLVRQGPQTFVVEVLEALRARLASPSGRPFPKYSNDLPPSRLGQQHHSGDALDNDELLEDSPSPIPGVRSIQIDKLLPSRERVAEPPSDRRVDVIVPVYRGFDETRRCLESVLGSRVYNRAFGRVLLIDDCGPEPELRAYLSEIARQDAVVLLTNSANMGFVASINRGMAYAAPNDVILLNSDTEVCGNWLDRLSIQAYADVRIGTVTPLSNNATICSYPDLGGQSALPTGTTLRAIDTACAQANALRAVQIPTAVGSCMYIKRSCLDHIGVFDESTFAEGYGEETDFCQRASRRGWIHMLAGDVFVFHLGEISFGTSSQEKKAKASAVMRERHPGYEPAVARWIQQDPALPLRLAVTAALWRLSRQPVVLHVLHSWGGGTEKHVAELAEYLATSARHLVLVTKRRGQHLAFLLLIPEPGGWRAIEFMSSTMTDVVPFLRSFALSQVHVHSFADVLDQISSFLKHLALPYDVTIHNYAAICPRVNLVRHDANYCGEPDEKGCLRCLLEGGYKLADDILWWRHHALSIIREADRVLCPSIDTGERIRKHGVGCRVIIAPHERQLYRPQRTLRLLPLAASDLLRVAVLGTLSEHKGGNFLLDCIEVGNELRAKVEWNVVGEFLSPPLKARANQLSEFLNVSGPYQAGDAQRLLADVAPHVLFFPQRWPETYSFTLSEALETGIPIIAPNIGSFTERIAGLSHCWLYPLEATAHAIVEKLVLIRRNYSGMAESFDDQADHWADPSGIPIEFQFYKTHYLRPL